jgi:hypothetical protein
MKITNTLQLINLKPTQQIFSYAQIILYGPLYSLVKQRGRLIKVRLHLSGDCYISLPIGIIARVFKKRLVLFGQKQRLMNFMYGFIKLRNNDIYTGTGLRQRGKGYHKKPGKIARR